MKRRHVRLRGYVVPLVLALLIPVWMLGGTNSIVRIPDTFTYNAQVLSLDNFYDEVQEKFTGEKRSVTNFSYTVVGKEWDTLLIKNTFDVRKITGDKIFAVEREYAIDPKTGAHVSGAGDRDREGYLFAPRHLRKGESFTYWHVNYDAPAVMSYAGEEYLFGLKVYRYESRYPDERIDQTANLTFLPGVPHARGIELDPYLQIWVEPTTGRLVKYKDQTVAYYYDRATGKRLHPWNAFSNTFARASVMEQVEIAKTEKVISDAIEFGIPLALALLSLTGIFFIHRRRWTAGILLVAGMIAIGFGIIRTAYITTNGEQARIGISLWVLPGHAEYAKNVQGFKDALTRAGFIEGKNIAYDIETASFDPNRQREIAERFKEKNVDLVYSLTTPGTLIMKEALGDRPIVFSIVTYPVEAGLIGSVGNSGNNLVGTRNWVPTEEQLSNFLQIAPHVKTIAFVHRKGEPNSTIQLQKMTEMAQKMGVSVVDVAGEGLVELQTALEAMQPVDAIYSACDTLVQSEAEMHIIAYARKKNLPSFSCNASGPEHGDLIGTVTDYYELGLLSGQQAAMILGGATPTSLETSTVARPFIILNAVRAAELRFVIPPGLRARAKQIIETP